MEHSSGPLSHTPLHSEHIALGAKMAPFGGWDMPIQYDGILAEHTQCRSAVSVFDICHMGEYYFKGDAAASDLEYAFTISIGRIAIGKCKYCFILHDNGGIIDDCIVYRLSDDEWMIVVNAANIEKDFKAIQSVLKGGLFEDRSAVTGKLDIQGPLSCDVLSSLISPEVKKLSYFGFASMDVLGEKSIVSRSGYTGELGYEIYATPETTKKLWKAVLADARVKPAGLGARDVLRLEMGYSLYGSDINDATTPLEAGLMFAVDMTKEFRGKAALAAMQKKNLARVKIGFLSASRRSPRAHFEIRSPAGEKIGEVTSGSFSPIMNAGIGMGYVTPEHSKIGDPIVITDGVTIIDAHVHGLPFHTNGTARAAAHA
ncbi:MAG: glycine cleavage system aminomethyltransferase GcvT [Spirochaetota bacterium]